MGAGGRLPLWTVKLLAALLMAAVCAAGCLLPVVVAAQAQKPGPQHQQKRSKYSLLQALLSLINCFAAGAFLGLAVIHLLPEAVVQLQRDGYLLIIRAGGEGKEAGSAHTYNIAYVLAAVGFTAMLAVEQFLAGGHAHCHRDVPLPMEGQRGRDTAARALPAFVDLSRCRSSVESSGLLQHSSHHHVQHHLLCTSANYCPGCDDCAEAATAAPAAGGEAAGATGAGTAVYRGCQLVATFEGSEAQVAKPPVQQVDQDDHGCGRVETDKKQRVLQLVRVLPEQLHGEDKFGLYKQEGPRTHSQETANTSTGCSDSTHERRRAPLAHPKKKHFADGASSTEKQLQKEEEAVVVSVYTVERAANSSPGSAVKKSELANCADSAAFSAQDDKADTERLQPQNDGQWVTDFAAAGAEVEMPQGVGLVTPDVVVAAAPISAVSAAGASGKQETGAAARGRRILQLLLGMPARHEVVKPVGSIRSSRDGGHASGSMVERNRSGSCNGSEWKHRGADMAHGNGSKDPCCSSKYHVTESQNAWFSTEQREGQRGSKTVGAAATPGATAGSRSAAVPGRCGCKNLEDVAPVTACCCSGCCKKCGDHSHDPESSSRVHSGSMGANVQGGDSAVEQQRGALNRSWRRVGGTRGSSVGQGQGEGKDGECGDNRKEGTETDFQVASVSSPPATIHSFDPLSPCSNSVRCCECSKRGETARILESGLLKKHNMHLHRQQQHLLGGAQQHHAKARARVAGCDDGGEHPHNRRSGVRTRALRWIKHFDAAKWSLTVALGVHALFEGVILGTTMKSEDVWIAALAILGHKAAEGVALSSTLLRLHMTRPHFLSVLGLFVLASPLGVFLGAVATMGGTGVCGVFNALAVGAVLYATNEMLSEFAGRCSRLRRVLKLLAFTLGLGMLFGLDLLHAPFCQQHNNEHPHHH